MIPSSPRQIYWQLDLSTKNILILTMFDKYFTFFDEAPHVIIGDKVDEPYDDMLNKFSVFLTKKSISIETID